MDGRSWIAISPTKPKVPSGVSFSPSFRATLCTKADISKVKKARLRTGPFLLRNAEVSPEHIGERWIRGISDCDGYSVVQ